MDTWMLQMFSIAFALFLLMDSIGNVPLFLAILKDIHVKRHKAIIIRELFIALIVILLFSFVGEPLLAFLNIKMPTLLISGGIILFLIAIKMIFPVKSDPKAGLPQNKEPFIVPLAIPLVAGPAVLAAVMLYSGQHAHNKMMTLTAIVVAWGASVLVLLSSALWKRLLGERGLTACERLMGLILTLMAIQMFFDGIEIFSRTCH